MVGSCIPYVLHRRDFSAEGFLAWHVIVLLIGLALWSGQLLSQLPQLRDLDSDSSLPKRELEIRVSLSKSPETEMQLLIHTGGAPKV